MTAVAEQAHDTSQIPAPEGALTVTVKILRYNPELDSEPHWESYDVPALPTDRVLNLLTSIKNYVDGTLSFRRSCAHGICGSDAMQINGINRLACKVLVKDLLAKKGKPTTISIAPIKGLTTQKDLYVDMEPFFEAFRAVKPYLISYGNEPTRERVQSTRTGSASTTPRSASCARAAPSSCPVYWTDGSYFGPAAIVNAHRFIFDSRDDGAEERLDILNDAEGVWRCRTTFNCTDACPRGIQVTKAIQEVKRALLFKRV